MSSVRLFERYVGIDYSGAMTASSRLKGLRIYMAGHSLPPIEILPAVSTHKYWSRREIAEWLVGLLLEGKPTLVGVDHGFSFPLRYFQQNSVPLDWKVFLDDFHLHWPTEEENVYVDFVRDGICGNAAARSGNPRWRRETEVRARGAKSVFHFDVPGSVAKSTHSGLPWLRYIRLHTAGAVHFWPFDGWGIPTRRSVVTEVYPALWSKSFSQGSRDSHQHDAFSITEWMRQADHDGSLSKFFDPSLNREERRIADIEGWILGVE